MATVNNGIYQPFQNAVNSTLLRSTKRDVSQNYIYRSDDVEIQISAGRSESISN